MELEIYQKNEIIAKFMGYTDDNIQAEEWCGCNVFMDSTFMDGDWMPANYHDSIAWIYSVWLHINDMVIKGDLPASRSYNMAKIALLCGNIEGLYNELFHIISTIK